MLKHDADDGDEFAHPEIMRVAFVRHKEGLVEVVGPDGVEGGDVARHAGHERGQQGGERQAEQAGRTVFFHERKDDAVVVVFGDAVVNALLDLVVGQFVRGVGGDQRGDFVRIHLFAERVAHGFDSGGRIGRVGVFHGGHGLGCRPPAQ